QAKAAVHLVAEADCAAGAVQRRIGAQGDSAGVGLGAGSGSGDAGRSGDVERRRASDRNARQGAGITDLTSEARRASRIGGQAEGTVHRATEGDGSAGAV